MKKLIVIFISLCSSVSSICAQTETQSFDAGGIKVIFKHTSKNIINVQLFFRGGVSNYTADKAGIENTTLGATVTCGAGKYNSAIFRDTAEKYGIDFSGASTLDYGYVRVNCVSKYFDKAWDMFSEAISNPRFEESELKLLKQKEIASNKEHYSNPGNILARLTMQNAFENTPYIIDPTGTEETVSKLNADDLKRYYKTILNKNKIFIVVVGNVTKQELFEKILAAFDNLPSEPYSPVEQQTPVWKDNRFQTEERPLKTNYVCAVMNAPDYTSINYVPFRLGVMGLSGNLYQRLRTQNNLSYNPGAEVVETKMPFAMMSTDANNPQQAVFGMMQVLKSIQSNGVDNEWLQHIKNVYLTHSYINEQSPAAICNILGEAEILGGWQYADDLPKLVQMVTVQQVNSALNYYITGLRWTYLGNIDAIEGFKPPPY